MIYRYSLSFLILVLSLSVTNSNAAPNFSGVFLNENVEALLSGVEALLSGKGKNNVLDGGVRGVVKEVGSDEPLIGANVVVKGTLKGVATDVDGAFLIRGIEAGFQTLVVSYLGFQAKEIDVEIVDGQIIELEVVLEWEGVEGDEVTITAQARGQVAAINQQLQSNTISNIVSGDRIKELPDVNAAESIGRLPGVSIQRSGGEATKVAIRGLSPKYNAVTVNGVRLPSTDANDRSVDLSLISSNMLDGIEVKKANTPDMDADALGGSIDLRLREAPEDPTFNVSAQGGYNQVQDYYGNYRFSIGGSSRFLNNKLGVIASVNTDEYDRTADKFSAGYILTSRTTEDGGLEFLTTPNSVNLREDAVVRGRFGGSMFLDYKLSNTGKITANGFFTELNNEGAFRINDMNGGANRHYYQVDLFKDKTSIYTGSLGFEQDFGFVVVDGSVSGTRSRSESPNNLQWQFSREGGAFVFPSDRFDPTVADTLSPDFILQGATNDSSLTSLSQFFIFENEREENTYSAQLNLEFPFQINESILGTIKTGTKFRWLDRFNDQNQYGRGGLQYGGSRSVLKCATDLMTTINADSIMSVEREENIPISYVLDSQYTRSNFLDGEYNLGFIPRDDVLRDLAAAAQSDECGFPLLREYSIGSIGSDYDGVERYQAGYVMAEINFGNKITFIPGFRYEREYSKYNGQSFIQQTSGLVEAPPQELTPLTVKRNHSFFLPMVHLQYEPVDWIKIRLARTETLTRPDFIQYAPNTQLTNMRQNYQAANTLLKPAVSTNYDASISFYENKLGLLTVSGFHKNIEDLIYYRQFNISPDFLALGVTPPAGANIPESWYSTSPSGGTFWNSPFESKYTGIEIDWQTSFWYLPSFLKGLVFSANLTLIDSETDYLRYEIVDSDSVKTLRPRTYFQTIKDTTFTDRIQDQPGTIANVTIGYDYKGFSIKLSGLYQSDITISVNAQQTVQSTYTGDYFRLDLTARQKLIEGLEVFLNLNNLNSRADRSFEARPNNNDRPTYTEYYGFTGDVGFRYNF